MFTKLSSNLFGQSSGLGSIMTPAPASTTLPSTNSLQSQSFMNPQPTTFMPTSQFISPSGTATSTGNSLFNTNLFSTNTTTLPPPTDLSNPLSFNFSSTPNQQQLNGTPSAVSTSVPNEVQVVLSHLSNADSRSCQLLSDVFQRLKALVTDPPVFIAFTYEIAPTPQILAAKRGAVEQVLNSLNKPQLAETYINAQKANPDNALYAIVPVEGFSGILQRCETQAQSYEKVNNLLHDLKTCQELARNHIQVQALSRIKSIQKRHERLQSKVIDVVELLEDYAITHSVAQLDINFLKRLKTDIASLLAEVYQSAVGRIRLNESMLKLNDLSKSVGIKTHSSDVSSTNENLLPTLTRPMVPDISDTSFKQVTRLIQKQDNLLDNLATTFRSLTLKSRKLLELLDSTNESVPS